VSKANQSMRLRNPERVELPLSNVSWCAWVTGWRKFTGSRLRITCGMRETVSTAKAVAAFVPHCATAVHMGGARSALGMRPSNFKGRSVGSMARPLPRMVGCRCNREVIREGELSFVGHAAPLG
jgi:hypothetical protein